MVYHHSLQLAENFYCYIWQGMGNNCNASLWCHVLRGKQPHILVDPGHIHNEVGEACLDSLTQAMENDGLSINDVGLIIVTHSHPDHFEAVHVITEKSKALVTLSKEEDDFHHNIGNKLYDAFGAKLPQVSPSFYLKEGELNLGSSNRVNVQVLLTPGHSPGSISLYWKEKKILISGDVVFWNSIGRTDLPGGSPSQLRNSIDKLSRLDVEYLIPGHSTEPGKIISGKQKVARNFQMVKMFI
jgi:glyoxylase-like metal-dependent hydrolase (beta-lactamase superfamily II)